MAETRFALDVVTALDRIDPLLALVVVAPPRMLAELRRVLPERLRRAIVAEVDKDLAMLNGNTAEFRLSEDTAFIEAMAPVYEKYVTTPEARDLVKRIQETQ